MTKGSLMRSVGAGLAVIFTVGHIVVASAQESKSITLSIPKMYCVACELSVKKALKKVPGVQNVDVDLEKKVAVVRFDSAKAATSDLTQATTKAGFPSSVKQ